MPRRGDFSLLRAVAALCEKSFSHAAKPRQNVRQAWLLRKPPSILWFLCLLRQKVFRHKRHKAQKNASGTRMVFPFFIKATIGTLRIPDLSRFYYTGLLLLFPVM